MKKLFSILLLLPFMAVAQKGTFSIKGNIKQLKDGDKVFLSYYTPMQQQVVDSSVVSNGTFQFSGNVIEPAKASLMVNVKSFLHYRPKEGVPLDFLAIYLEPAELKVIAADSLNNAIISGGSVNSDEADFQSLMSPVFEKWRSYYNKYEKLTEEQKKDKKISDELEEQALTIWKEEMKLSSSFIEAKPGSFISLGLLQKLIEIPEYFAIHRKSFDAFSPAMKATPTGMMTGGRLGVLEKLANLKTAIDFELTDSNGKPVKLSDFRGKYVLLDFWASWCVPCRNENPNIMMNYQKYKDKGFTVLGVSVDSDKNKWLKAVAEDKLEWTQVLDGTGKITAASQYSVASLPTNFLIDPTGKIVAYQLKSKDLGAKLEEIFKGK